MLRILLTLAVIALIVYAATDCAGSTDDERRGVPKPLWMLIIIVLPVFGAVAWLIQRYSGRKNRPRPARSPRPPVAPDDDPDFLWRLEQERRRRQAGGATGSAAREPDDTTPHAGGPGGSSGTTGGASGPTGDASGPAGASDDPTDDATDNGKGTGSHP
ncbi:hypothetical protein GCM10011331_07290 [Flavimobilis marinus]|uniref:Phospholipase_D-nuclease N-terminal n=1 Tax=Flavimobilis marinus TaxID=285351 RepID=A0A1I2CVP1_9MICO|nr:PLD nuclease N-terminal domain-containing protein [Flavimobilis marinus]GHG46919.1 hypothetical protein GCM10011331_07290 [Flavimobilis marinus]SFE71780.1 Phospholipase_D-nuclease N-terminal [Flavimobilis marinus]